MRCPSKLLKTIFSGTSHFVKPIIYAMAGPIGAGKTTLARKLSIEKQAVFFSIDDYVKKLNQPIQNASDYEKYYFGVRDIITDAAAKILQLGVPVVFDFGGTLGHSDWLKQLADDCQASIEIYHLLVPIEIRRERVRNRNLDKNSTFKFSETFFDSMPTQSVVPAERDGLTVIEIHNH